MKLNKLLPILVTTTPLISLASCTVQINPEPEPEEGYIINPTCDENSSIVIDKNIEGDDIEATITIENGFDIDSNKSKVLSGSDDITDSCELKQVGSAPITYKLTIPHNLVTDKLNIDIKAISELAMETNILKTILDYNVNVLTNNKPITFEGNKSYTFNIDLKKYDWETGGLKEPMKQGIFWIGDLSPIVPVTTIIKKASVTISNGTTQDVLTQTSAPSDVDKTFSIKEHGIIYCYQDIGTQHETTINLELQAQVENVRPCYLPGSFGG